MDIAIFYIFAAAAVTSALMVVFQKRAVYSALALILCFGSMAVLFYQLGAHFIGAIQVIVYAGAIMVLFLFVIMLLDPESEIFAKNRLKRVALFGLPSVLILLAILFRAFPEFAGRRVAGGSTGLIAIDSTELVAKNLFHDYLLPFEVTSVLILVAVMGAVVLAKRHN